jgi:hypothetical protein
LKTGTKKSTLTKEPEENPNKKQKRKEVRKHGDNKTAKAQPWRQTAG